MALHQQSPLLSVKSLIGLLFAFLLHLTIFDNGALASPLSSVATQPNQLSERYTGDIAPGDPTNYPTDDQIRADYITSSQPTVFYSNIGPPDKAQQFAASINGRLLRDCWPDGYSKYNGRGKAGYANFIDRVSGILADNAAGQVYFVGQWPNAHVDKCRVWARVEYASLQANSQVTQITLVDHNDFTQTKDYPGLNTKVKRDDEYCVDWSGKVKRDDEACFGWSDKVKRGGDYCFDWDGDDENPLGDYSET